MTDGNIRQLRDRKDGQVVAPTKTAKKPNLVDDYKSGELVVEDNGGLLKPNKKDKGKGKPKRGTAAKDNEDIEIITQTPAQKGKDIQPPAQEEKDGYPEPVDRQYTAQEYMDQDTPPTVPPPNNYFIRFKVCSVMINKYPHQKIKSRIHDFGEGILHIPSTHRRKESTSHDARHLQKYTINVLHSAIKELLELNQFGLKEALRKEVFVHSSEQIGGADGWWDNPYVLRVNWGKSSQHKSLRLNTNFDLYSALGQLEM